MSQIELFEQLVDMADSSPQVASHYDNKPPGYIGHAIPERQYVDRLADIMHRVGIPDAQPKLV